MPRNAVIYGTKGCISLNDFHFEYQIREVERCVNLEMITSDVLKKEDTLDVLIFL